jgi:trans-aconitate methyltransferase
MVQMIRIPPRTVLDIGCGGGVLIHTMKQNWPRAKFWGVEPSPNFCDLSSRRTNAVIKNGLFRQGDFPDQTFDLITCCQVFEHVQDLKSFVRAIKTNMHSLSFFYLEVPDISDFDFLDANHSRFTEPSHLWYFGETFLRNFLGNEGFKVQSSKIHRTVRGRNNLTLILQRI